MAIRKLIMTNGWTWHMLKDLSQVKQNEIRYEHLDFFRCMGDYHLFRVKSPHMHKEEQGGNALYGSFLYGDLPDQREEGLRLIYYVSERHLFTAQLQLSHIGTSESELIPRLQLQTHAFEALLDILGDMAQTCHYGLDKFEDELTVLERTMRNSKNSELLDQLMELQYDLVHWQRRIVPFEELLLAGQEAFPEWSGESSETYKLLSVRVQRLVLRLKRYQEELTAMLTIDARITSFRGNAIMKTLTVFAVFCAPAAVVVAIAGMIFENMSKMEYPWGYLGSILMLTFLIYIWFWWKGWTGDLVRGLVRGKKRNSSMN